MDLSCLPAPVRDDLARVSFLALPPSLLWRVDNWADLDDAEREVTAADLRLMAGLTLR